MSLQLYMASQKPTTYSLIVHVLLISWPECIPSNHHSSSKTFKVLLVTKHIHLVIAIKLWLFEKLEHTQWGCNQRTTHPAKFVTSGNDMEYDKLTTILYWRERSRAPYNEGGILYRLNITIEEIAAWRGNYLLANIEQIYRPNVNQLRIIGFVIQCWLNYPDNAEMNLHTRHLHSYIMQKTLTATVASSQRPLDYESQLQMLKMFGA